MNDTKIQWHSGFAAAMELELAPFRDILTFHREFNLNTKPLMIDLLVIQKETDIQITNEIGTFFRRHNILEYKSPDDKLNIDTIYKSNAYAFLYKSYGETVDQRKADDITISIIREARPSKLFRYFKAHGVRIRNPHRGIYYVQGFLFPVQIIVAKELDPAGNTWLRSLSARMKKQDMENLLHKINALQSGYDKELADSVLEVSIRANQQIIDELRGDEHMCQALLEIMEPEINKIKESVTESVTDSVTKSVTESVTKSVTESVTKSVTESVTEDKILSAVKSFRDFGISDTQILEALVKNFNLSSAEAHAYL